MSNNDLKQVNVNNYIYHQSNPMFRKKILEEWLITQPKSDTWLEDTNIDGKVIFASNTYNKTKWFFSWYDDDIYEIDTSTLWNIWFEDPNYDWNEENNYIITFENIPAESITLIYKWTWDNLDDDEFFYHKAISKIILSE